MVLPEILQDFPALAGLGGIAARIRLQKRRQALVVQRVVGHELFERTHLLVKDKPPPSFIRKYEESRSISVSVSPPAPEEVIMQFLGIMSESIP